MKFFILISALISSVSSVSFAEVFKSNRTYTIAPNSQRIKVNVDVPTLEFRRDPKATQPSLLVMTLSDSSFGGERLLDYITSREVIGPINETHFVTSSGSWSFECSISRHNGKITKLKGDCFDRAIMTLPKNAQIEIYQANKLLTPIYIPISNEELAINLRSTAFDDNKLVVIGEFLKSYKQTKTIPSYSSDFLGTIIKGMSLSAKKLQALTLLHPYTADRENLQKMIEYSFTFNSDKAAAKKIIGL